MTYADVVDLARYPIDDLDGEQGRSLIARCRRELAATGACALAGFLTAAAVGEMVAIGSTLSEKAWVSDEAHTVYFEPVDDAVAPTHPRARLVRSAKRGIAYDYIAAGAPVRRLYESDEMTRFVGAVLDKDPLYRSADPLDALQITLFEQGDELGWHFDNSEFSVTLMYQKAESGGDFEYVPWLRSEADPCYADVQRVLDGEEAPTQLLGSPGTLAVFRGHHALHRVSRVEGARPRINSVLTYGEQPDMRLNDLTSQLFYGRTSSGGL